MSGDTSKRAQAQLFSWEAQHASVDVHLLAEPTKAEKLKIEYIGKKKEIKSSIQESILERYSGKEHLQVLPKALLLAQTEQYVEYSRAGKIIKGAEKPVVSSCYEEDVYIYNHHSVSLFIKNTSNCLVLRFSGGFSSLIRYGAHIGKTVNGDSSVVIRR